MADTDSPPGYASDASVISFGVMKVASPGVGGGMSSVARLVLTAIVLIVAAGYVRRRRAFFRDRDQARRAEERWEGEGGAAPPAGEVRG
jgi:hypothetical protein